MRSILAGGAFVLAVASGCSRAGSRTPFVPESKSPVNTAADNPLPRGDSAWNPEARADHLVGSIAASVGFVLHERELARSERDVVKLSCLDQKLGQLWPLEGRARQLRTNVRDATIEDDSNTSAYDELVSAESTARGLRNESQQCVGEEMAQLESADSGGDRDADGIVDVADAEPKYQVRLRQLDSSVDELKDQVFRSKARMSLLGNTVLAGGSASTTAPTSPPSNPLPAQPTSPTSAQEGHDASMLIRTAELSLAVYEVDKNLAAVEKSALELGGYLALRSDREITVRVPREKFDELVSRVEKMGDVLHKNVAAEDVTDQYVDIDMRLKNAIAVRARLEKLLESATVHDAVEIHRELSKVTEEIERYQGKLKLLRDRISYSTVTVTFEQSQTQVVKTQALLPFPWMNTMGLSPLLRVPR